MDGAPGGWVAATRDTLRGHARFTDILDHHPNATIYVDIPIGLLDTRRGSGDRPCDKEARAALGKRGRSVFPPPRRAQLRHAGRPYRAGLGISAQTHAILPKIREVDEALRSRYQVSRPPPPEPLLPGVPGSASSRGSRYQVSRPSPSPAPRVREAHPELAFLLAARHPLASKRSLEGRAQRERVLRRAGLFFRETGLGVRASRADVDDAAVLVWLGEEVDAGRVGGYGEPPFVIWGRPLQGNP